MQEIAFPLDLVYCSVTVYWETFSVCVVISDVEWQQRIQGVWCLPTVGITESELEEEGCHNWELFESNISCWSVVSNLTGLLQTLVIFEEIFCKRFLCVFNLTKFYKMHLLWSRLKWMCLSFVYKETQYNCKMLKG